MSNYSFVDDKGYNMEYKEHRSNSKIVKVHREFLEKYFPNVFYVGHIIDRSEGGYQIDGVRLEACLPRKLSKLRGDVDEYGETREETEFREQFASVAHILADMVAEEFGGIRTFAKTTLNLCTKPPTVIENIFNKLHLNGTVSASDDFTFEQDGGMS